VLERTPVDAELHNKLGVVLHLQGKTDDAIACYRRALELDPNYAEAHSQLGNALSERGKFDEAVANYRRALELRPELVEAYTNLGMSLTEVGQFEEAVACHHQALALQPDFAEVHSNLGGTLQKQGKLEDAAACYRRAVELKPGLAEAHVNLGNAETALGRYADAEGSYRRALTLKADYPDAHTGLAAIKLLRGEFESGWKEYEWRWRCRRMRPRDFRQPVWDGGPLRGKTILLHAEQGLGDTLQFIRYAPLVKAQGGQVVVDVQRPLLKLLAQSRGIDRLMGHGNQLPEFDVHAPLLSLPRIFQTTLETVPATIPYVFAEPWLVAEWREKLAHLNGFRIGINWHGRAGHGEFRNRNIPLEQFGALARLSAVNLISLQKGEGSEELLEARQRAPIVDLGPEFDTAHGAFMDTAAVMKNLDLVITSDTSIPHLAGALGVRVWVALPYAADWRWLLDRSDSPWYPTTRLFRQKRPGDWAGVFDEMETALQNEMARRG